MDRFSVRAVRDKIISDDARRISDDHMLRRHFISETERVNWNAKFTQIFSMCKVNSHEVL